MKNKLSVIILSFLSLLFLSFTVLFFGTNSLFDFHHDVTQTIPNKTSYEVSDIIELKVGEKVKFSELNPYFKDFEFTNYSDYLHEYNDYPLTIAKGTQLDNYLGRNFTVDKNGYLTANKVGLYKFEYLLSQISSEPLGGKVQNFTFSNLFYVIDDFANYTPVYEAEDFYNKNPNENYILKNDVTVNTADYYFRAGVHFSGTFINPYGYTITIKKEKDNDEVGALFGVNNGVLDGLKIRFDSDLSRPYTEGFYGIVKQNNGLIKDCDISGTVFSTTVTDDFCVAPDQTNTDELNGCAFVLPREGYVINNTSTDLKIYSNNYISLYNYQYTNVIPNELAKYKRVENNKLEVDFYYVNDNLALKQRLPYFEKEREESNNTYYCPTSKSYPDVTNKAPVTLKIKLDEGYQTIINDNLVNSPLTVNPKDVVNIFETRYYEEPEMEVKYWLVDGQRFETLDDLICTKALTIEPVVKYTRSYFCITDRYYNANEEVMNVTFHMGLTLSQDFFSKFFKNPRNVIPKKIIIGSTCYFYYDSRLKTDIFNADSTYRLQDYIRNGGKMEISTTNPQYAFINNKFLCYKTNMQLLHYFPASNEKTVTIHNQVQNIAPYAFVGCEDITEVDFGNASTIYYECSNDIPNVEKITFGPYFELTGTTSGSKTLAEFAQNLRNLEEVSISEANPTYKVIDGFVVSKSNNDRLTLHLAMPTLTGEITLPAGITDMNYGCFCGSDVEVIKFNEVYTETLNFNVGAFENMQNLKRIEFGNFKNLSSTESNNRTKLPNLTTITFKENVEDCSLDFAINDFESANLQKVVLPKTLSYFTPVLCSEFQISEENPYYFTQDGVLYNENSEGIKSLIAFPYQKEVEEYAILDGTVQIGAYAFYRSKVKCVTINPEAVFITDRAFASSNVQKILLKESNDYQFSKSNSFTIGSYAFESCKDLCEIDLGERTISVSEGAFWGCSSLTSFSFLNTESIGVHSFTESGIKEVVIGATTSDIYNFAFENSAVERVTFTADCAISSLPTSLFENCQNLTEVNLGNVTSLGLNVFKTCANLTSINLDKILFIAESAFENCASIKSVYMPLVTVIRRNAFYGCENLQEVTFADEITVADSAFANCKSLTTLNSTITDIHVKAFTNCNSLTGLRLKDINSLDSAYLPNNTAEFVLYLDVNDTFTFIGVIPENYTIYVPSDLIENFLNEWIVNPDQLIAYDFSDNKE